MGCGGCDAQGGGGMNKITYTDKHGRVWEYDDIRGGIWKYGASRVQMALGGEWIYIVFAGYAMADGNYLKSFKSCIDAMNSELTVDK